MLLSDRTGDSIFCDAICYRSTRVLQASIVLSLLSSLLYLSCHPAPLSPLYQPFLPSLLARHRFVLPLCCHVLTASCPMLCACIYSVSSVYLYLHFSCFWQHSRVGGAQGEPRPGTPYLQHWWWYKLMHPLLAIHVLFRGPARAVWGNIIDSFKCLQHLISTPDLCRTCTKLKQCQCRGFLTQNGQFQFSKACIFTWNCRAHSCIHLKLNARWFQPKVLYHWKVRHPGQDFSRRGGDKPLSSKTEGIFSAVGKSENSPNVLGYSRGKGKLEDENPSEFWLDLKGFAQK